jgi:uncharacterized OB-fold protein
MILETAQRLKEAGFCAPRAARDPVNLPMINSWQEALGDRNPRYAAQGIAPPAMAQVWTMRGLHPVPTKDDPLTVMAGVLDEAGYTSVVATNCEQTYHRPLRIGEEVTVRSRLSDLAGPKRTALGEGWFLTTESVWFVGEEPIATMLFRVLKYAPAPSSPPTATGAAIRPVISKDTKYFWDGTAEGELRIQQCTECGRLRHPPGLMCPECGSVKPSYVVASGAGTVYSYVVHHHPPVPGRRTPFVVALVELEEGVRVVGELLGVAPDQVRIGMPVSFDTAAIGDGVFLPVWRPRSDLPPLAIEITPTFVVSSALATRDFQDVHHDRDLAVMRGSKDIFINILTTTGLVQRFITDWEPDIEIKSISVKLGVPCYAYDMLTLTGRFLSENEMEVLGRNSLGAHVTATVVVDRA